MHHTVQEFLKTAPEGVEFETTVGRFRFVSRTGHPGYQIEWKVLGGKWEMVPAYKVRGELKK